MSHLDGLVVVLVAPVIYYGCSSSSATASGSGAFT